jgi:hypothetical protein
MPIVACVVKIEDFLAFIGYMSNWEHSEVTLG